MHRLTAFCILTCLSLPPSSLLAQSGASTAATAGRPAPAPVRAADPRAATMQKMNRLITIELNEARLEDAIQFIRDYTGADLDVLWADDSAAGLDKDKIITVTVREVPTLRLLQRVLEKAQEEFDENTWQMTDSGIIEIGPKSRLNKSKYLKIYDIQDLLFVIPDFTQVPELDLDSVLNQGQSGGGGGQGSIFEDDEEEDDERRTTEEELAQKIIDLLVENVEPEQWQDNGGDGATVRFYNGSLLIRAPEYIHRQINGPEYRSRPASSRTGAAAPVAPSSTSTAAAPVAPSSPVVPGAPAAAPQTPAQATTPAGAPAPSAPGQ